MGLDELLKERETLVAQGLGLAEKFREGKFEPADHDAVKSIEERLKAIEAEVLTTRSSAAGIDFIKAADERIRAAGRHVLYPGAGDPDPNPSDGAQDLSGMTPGEAFVSSENYRAWMNRNPNGGPGEGTMDTSGQVQFAAYRAALEMYNATDKFRGKFISRGKMRALVSSAGTSAGDLIWPDFRGLLEPGLVRPTVVRQLVTVIPITTNAIEYVKEVSRASNAQSVAEATAATGSSGLKPEGGVVFDIVPETVKTIAEWIPATRNILADAPTLRGYIDALLTDDLAIELEDQIIGGSGAMELPGILNDPNIGTEGPPGSGKNMLDALRAGKRSVQVLGRTTPTAVVMNPEDVEEMDTLKASTAGTYLGSNPFAFTLNNSVWAMTVVESEAIAPGHALVGDFRRYVLFDRESTTISVGTANDDFLRNIVRVLAEMRAAGAVLRPKAFCNVDLAA